MKDTLTNDITGLQADRILFDSTSDPFVIGGNGFMLGNDFINNSLSSQAINTPVVLTGQTTIYNGGGSTGSGTITFSNVISGSGSIVKSGSGEVVISGLNTYSGGTTINGIGSGWAPQYGFSINVNGTGTSGAPTAGAFGTGTITMNGGSINVRTATVDTLYNNIFAPAGTSSYFFSETGGLALGGKLTGTGQLSMDANNYGGLSLFGDNTGFAGTFRCINRSSQNRLKFTTAKSGSPNAIWNLNNRYTDGQGLTFGADTIDFGQLDGGGYIRNDASQATFVRIGALNTASNFYGVMVGTITILNVGSGDLFLSGNNSFTGNTIIRGGRLLLVNDPATGTFTSPVSVVGGVFGGTGVSTSSAIIGTGLGAGATLQPGNSGVGTLTVGTLTMNVDATFALDVNSTVGKADSVKVSGLTLNTPTLAVSDVLPGAFPLGTSLMIVNNVGANQVVGTFKNLPELSLITLSGVDFRITYKGGDGNDVVLLDNRTAPSYINSSNNATAIVNKPFNFQVTGINIPTGFSASGLPSGLTIDNASGVISGTPTIVGVYSVTLGTTSANGSASSTLTLTVQGTVVTNLFAAGGDAKDTLSWDPMLNVTFNVKRSTTNGGPYTTLANVSSNAYMDNTAVNGIVYYYVISTVDADGENANSAPVSASPNLGQISYYKFDESSGTKIYDYWSGKSATAQAGATRITGKLNNALNFNGTATSYATLPTGVISNLTTNYTFSVWVNMTSISTWMRAFDFGNGSTQYVFLTPQAGLSGANSIVRFAIKNGSAAEQNISYNYLFPKSTWVHLAVTQSGTTTTLYINGSSVATSTAITIKPSALGNTTLNYLGKSQFADPMFNGGVDELKIYNRALSSTEISSLYTSTVLPVSLISYNAVLQNNGSAQLNWKTGTEENNSYFIIERSLDGNSFTQISGKVVSKDATGSEYAYIDNLPEEGINYYRLKQVDKDGKVTDLGIRTINVGEKMNKWKLYPNPVVNGTIYLKNKSILTSSNPIIVKLVNSAGVVVLSKVFGASNTLTIDLDGKLVPGHYVVMVDDKTALPVIIAPIK